MSTPTHTHNESDTDRIKRLAHEKVWDGVKRLAMLLGACATAAALCGAWMTFPHRLGAVEKAAEQLQRSREVDHEALVRIETVLGEIKRRIERMENGKNP